MTVPSVHGTKNKYCTTIHGKQGPVSMDNQRGQLNVHGIIGIDEINL